MYTKKIKTTLLINLFLMAFFMAAAAGEDAFVRYPAISSDGNELLFTYQGDIWKVNAQGGSAMRLTTNPANDTRPLWSPDNKAVAFSSNRNGNYDIYTFDIAGNPVNQLTHHSKHDILSSWHGEEILFTSSRFFAQVEREDDMLKINAEGGTPNRFLDVVGFEPSPSPDGNLIAFVRGSCRTSREAYRGAANRDIWIYNTKSKAFHQITNFEGNDFMPRWKNNSTIAFISARNGKYNVFEKAVDEQGQANGDATALSDYKNNGVRYFTLSGDGKIIALEKGTGIFILENGQDRKVEITITKDYMFPLEEFKTYKKDIDNYVLSPEEKQIAFTIHGNLYVRYNDKRATNTKLVQGEAARVKSFEWLDEKTIVYNSDKHHQYDLFTVQPEDQAATLYEAIAYEHTRLTKTGEDEPFLTLHPESKQIAFIRGKGTLITAFMEEGQLQDLTVLTEGWATPSDIAWSPDGKWLAYSQQDLKANSEIYIHRADGSQDAVNVSLHPRSDASPVWSRDKLAFISERNNGDRDIWFVWLTKEDWERTNTEWQEKTFLEDSTKQQTGDIAIDFDNIYKRITQVTGLPGNESDLQISPDGKTFYFVTNRNDRSRYKAHNDIYSIKWNGKELKPVTKGNKSPYRVRIDKKGNTLYSLRKGGKLVKTTLKSKKDEPLTFVSRAWIDYQEQRKQIFGEAWRALEQGFYDPDFHGENWNKLREKYEPWCMAASTNEDFRYTFNLMLGQVNASHMGLRNIPERYETPKNTTGLLGVDIAPEAEGIRIKKVLQNTPAARSGSTLLPGDVIRSVNGQLVSEERNFYRPLNNTADQEVILNILRENTSQDIVIRPVKSIRTQRYEDWVEERRRITEATSNGKLGYIHIRGMNWNSFEQFERELAASAYDKEGLVVDVRYNGGGWTTDYLMAVLDVQQHSYTIPRGATKNLDKEHQQFSEFYPFGARLPFFPWTKPSIALCNQNSYSNAEIFSHAYKSLGLGKLVGTPTFGAVISTGGVRLVDGSYVRLPFRAWYVKATGKNMELNGAVPDIIVNNPPDSKAKGEDPQLERAINELLNKSNK
jgi:tricorn protease